GEGRAQRPHDAAEEGQGGTEPTPRRLGDPEQPARRGRLRCAPARVRQVDGLLERGDCGSGRAVERRALTLREQRGEFVRCGTRGTRGTTATTRLRSHRPLRRTSRESFKAGSQGPVRGVVERTLLQ